MKQFIAEAQRLQKLAGISEIKIIPRVDPFEIPEGWSQLEPNPELDEEDITIEEYGAPMEGWDENNYDYISIMKTPENQYYVKVSYAFGDDENGKLYNNMYEAKKEAVDLMNEIKSDWDEDDNEELDEVKILPPIGSISPEELIEKIIDLYIDLYDQDSDKLDNILSKHIPDRVRYNANLSYKEMFETLDQQTLEKLYNDLRGISELKIIPSVMDIPKDVKNYLSDMIKEFCVNNDNEYPEGTKVSFAHEEIEKGDRDNYDDEDVDTFYKTRDYLKKHQPITINDTKIDYTFSTDGEDVYIEWIEPNWDDFRNNQ
jgi:hypothetical protein